MALFVRAAMVIVIVSFISGCATVDKWEWEAGRIFFANKGINNCIKRCRMLSDEMKAEGVEHYLVSGYYCHKRHRWIERGGEILDPSVSLSSPDLYKAVTRVKISGDAVKK